MEKVKTVYAVATDKGNLTLLFFMVVSLAITWATIGQIEYNYQLEQQAQTLQSEVDVLQQQNTNQQLRNEFLQTDYFAELAAREQLGLVSPGEKVVIISDQQIAKVLEETNLETHQTATSESLGQASALEQWYRFFRGKSPL